MSLASDDLEHVVVPGRHCTPTASAGSVTAVSGNEVESDLAQEGEVAGGGVVAHPAVILAEGDVEHPVQGVLDAPVPAHDGSDQDGGSSPQLVRKERVSASILPAPVTPRIGEPGEARR